MPTSNQINANGTGLVRYDGAGNFDAVTTTDHNLLIGAPTNGITSVSPSATLGIPLVSQGSAVDPIFGTAQVAGGGTGAVSFTDFAVVCGGTSPTNPLQNVASVGVAGMVLVSNGPGVLPSFQTGGGSGFLMINVQTFTTPGVSLYTPSAGMKYCIVEMTGGGGAGAGCPAHSGATLGVTTGGGGGEYARGVFSAASIGVSQSVTVGTGGIGIAGGTGASGTASSIGALMLANGGIHGNQSPFGTGVIAVGGLGGSGGTGGDLHVPGSAANSGVSFGIPSSGAGFTVPGGGGNSFFGAGGLAPMGDVNGINGLGFGAGGSGTAVGFVTLPALTGGNGTSGIVIITEFI